MDKKEIQRLANHLILNGRLIDDIGLFYRKMGVAFFLYYYKCYTKEFMCEFLGKNRVEDIYENIHENMPVRMDKGLRGVAWGISSLLENNFMGGDADEILIDNEIMERGPIHATDLSIEFMEACIPMCVCIYKI